MSSVLSSIVTWFATLVYSAMIHGLGWALSWWQSIPSAVVPDPDADRPGGYSPPMPAGMDQIVTIISYLKWASLAVCVLGLLVWAGSLAWGAAKGGSDFLGKMVTWLVGVMLASGGVSLTCWVCGVVTKYFFGNSTVGFLQGSLWWIAVACCSVTLVVGGGVIAWQQKSEDIRKLASSVGTFLATCGLGMSLIVLAIQAGDQFSVWIIGQATDCKGADMGNCVTAVMSMQVLGIQNATWDVWAALLFLILGLLGVIGSIFQIVVFAFKEAVMVVLCGVLPLSASFTFFETGRGFFNKITGWIIAFLLYKPAAAIIYAAGLMMMQGGLGSDMVWPIVYGSALIVMAALALPILLRLVVPMTSPAAGGSGAGGVIAAGAGAALMFSMARGAGRGGSGGGGGGAPSWGPPTGAPAPGGAPNGAPAPGGTPSGNPSGGTPSGTPGAGSPYGSPVGGGAGSPGSSSGAGVAPAGAGSGSGPATSSSSGSGSSGPGWATPVVAGAGALGQSSGDGGDD